ncbi:helix-turn-helix domain-containing protein [Sulfitobacter mediterraneus]|uniref:helix-turn-helix domain-containing protein n=1 Tax=Sulfitobacter mediterraneus TaxID=83219 RepID=UPI0021A54060|nr:helix-turn-helix domain-containing protein [Sulfitobacter mediterraneus]UWR09969.1 helix-turn-helix domain-containing protein [Sulfitobacter mediterraneus]
MAKRVNPMAVKANATYDVLEAARALNVTPATIRNWIKDGLEAMTSAKPYLILGSAIREYLQERYAAARRPLKDDELFCPSCGKGRKPLNLLVSQSQITIKTDLLKGICQHCGCTATRMISHKQRLVFATTFQISKEPISKA